MTMLTGALDSSAFKRVLWEEALEECVSKGVVFGKYFKSVMAIPLN